MFFIFQLANATDNHYIFDKKNIKCIILKFNGQLLTVSRHDIKRCDLFGYSFRGDASKQILKKYGVDSIVINNKILDEIVGADFVTYHSIFAKSITRSGSRVYDNYKESIYNY